MLIPLPDNGGAMPAASPIISTWFSTCVFRSKLICAIVTGWSNTLTVDWKTSSRYGFCLKMVVSISGIEWPQAFKFPAVVI